MTDFLDYLNAKYHLLLDCVEPLHIYEQLWHKKHHPGTSAAYQLLYEIRLDFFEMIIKTAKLHHIKLPHIKDLICFSSYENLCQYMPEYLASASSRYTHIIHHEEFEFFVLSVSDEYDNILQDIAKYHEKNMLLENVPTHDIPGVIIKV